MFLYLLIELKKYPNIVASETACLSKLVNNGLLFNMYVYYIGSGYGA